jgi:hypothetical protein
MGVPALSANDLKELKGYRLGFERSTPLWYYVLKEAEVMEGGLHLGPVGGRIVEEPSQASRRTGLRRVPTPLTETSTTSPSRR